MRILAIETSCDETAVALLDISGSLENPDIVVLGNSLLSQASLHEKYGGVYPNLAKREHEKNLPILLKQTLIEAGFMSEADLMTIDCIAITAGPGLEPALWTGITFAENLGKRLGKVVLAINHMEGHIYSVLFEMPKSEFLKLPALALLVSGGHTELVIVRDFGINEILGETRDDAVGEAFDKVARMLGLPYPGGPQISKLAKLSRQKKGQIDITLPRPMIHSQGFDFSFSGLKTAVLYKLKTAIQNDEYREDMARAFEDAAVEVLVEKTRRALRESCPDVKTLIVAGGVSANIHLRNELEKLSTEFPEIKQRLPSKTMTGDNAIMIGIVAYLKVKKNPELLEKKLTLKADGNLSISSAQ